MRIILTESQYEELYIRRRIPEIKDIVKHTLPYENPCDYDSVYHFLESIYEESMMALPDKFFHTSESQTIVYKIFDTIGQDLTEYWRESCKRK